MKDVFRMGRKKKDNYDYTKSLAVMSDRALHIHLIIHLLGLEQPHQTRDVINRVTCYEYEQKRKYKHDRK